jgi:FAD:protein FMN transferase
MTAAVAPNRLHDLDRLHHVEHVMGTAVSFDIRSGPSDRSALDDAVAWLHHVDETFSTYRDDSPVSRLGRGELRLREVSEEIRDVLLLCERIRDETGGAFDALAVPAPNGTMLDPSGLVKGWSIERAAVILAEHGHSDFLINGGGDIALRGNAEPGRPWTVGIRDPHDRAAIASTISAAGPFAIATSGTYERGAHIIDPHVGRPVADIASATVTGPDLTFADAYATAVFVMGEVGIEWIDGIPGYEAVVIRHDGIVVRSNGYGTMQSSLTIPANPS